jgi:hypothetical protein
MNIETDDQENDQALEQARTEAFQAPPETWNEKTLHPFTISRKSFFLAWRDHAGAPTILHILGSDPFAFLADAIRLIYLGLLTGPDLEDIRDDLPALQRAADEWADANVAEGQEGEIIGIGLKIWNGTRINQHSVPADPEHASRVGK